MGEYNQKFTKYQNFPYCPPPPHIAASLSFNSSNRDTEFSRLHVRVAETAVERNFRLRGKKPPRANLAIKLIPAQKAAASRSPPARFHPPPRRSVRRFARSTGRSQDRHERKRKSERRMRERPGAAILFAMGKRDRGTQRSVVGHERSGRMGGREERANCAAWTEK